jgi:hypothetical protein
MKILLYMLGGIAWVGVLFFKPLIKDINKVNVLKTLAINLFLWPACIGVYLFNHFTGRETLFGKDEDDKESTES